MQQDLDNWINFTINKEPIRAGTVMEKPLANFLDAKPLVKQKNLQEVFQQNEV